MPSFRATLFYLIISYKQGLQSSIYQKLKKTAKFVSGFNSFSKEEQALYDKAHVSRDIKNQCFTWAGIMLVGAVLSYFLTPYMAIPAFIIWLVLLFKEVHFDTHKAFEKYLLK